MKLHYKKTGYQRKMSKQELNGIFGNFVHTQSQENKRLKAIYRRIAAMFAFRGKYNGIR